MKKILLPIIIAISSIFCFTGCYDAVFQSIRKEVELEDVLMPGYINSIVRYTLSDGTERLYVQNGLIHYKDVSDESGGLTANASHGCWTEDDSAPKGLSYSYEDQEFEGTYFVKLASDSSYVYALGGVPIYDSSSGRNILQNFYLYYYDGSTWQKADDINTLIETYISLLDEDEYMMDASIQLFCTNTPQKEHRYAYIRIGGGDPKEEEFSEAQEYGEDITNGNCAIFQLDGASYSFIAEGTGAIGSLSTGANKQTLSAVYANGDVYFLDYVATGTNETKDTDATYVYYGNDEDLISFEAEIIDTVASTDCITTEGCDDEILSLCVTADSVLLGTYEEGAYRVLTTDGKPHTSTTDFETNGDDIMTSPYIIRMLFCTDPSIGEREEGSTLYSSMQFRYTQSSASADYDNVALWSYYYSRDEWNVE